MNYVVCPLDQFGEMVTLILENGTGLVPFKQVKALIDRCEGLKAITDEQVATLTRMEAEAASKKNQPTP